MPRTPRARKPAPSLTPDAYQLRVELIGSDPPIWRRFLVAADGSLAELHDVLQLVLGWTDAHLHAFEIGRERYGVPDPDDGEPVRDERAALLGRVLPPPGGAFTYEYDFGDSWEHALEVEAIRAGVGRSKLPVCLDGARACPPEDSGGMHGFDHLLAVVADRRHPDHREMKAWLGEFDPGAFDLDSINARLAKMRRAPSAS